MPTALGELLMGVLVGNLFYHWGYELMVILREGATCSDVARLALSGQTWDEAARTVIGDESGGEIIAMLRRPEGGLYMQFSQAMDMFTNYGVMFILFHVGLSTHVAELHRLGREPMKVAVIGAFVPMILGFLVIWLLDPATSQAGHIFMAATLGATSFAFAAQILKKLNQTESRAARTILGAAVIDDVIGLVMLAIVSGIAMTGSTGLEDIGRTIAHASLFIICALGLGPSFLRFLVWMMRRFDVLEATLFVSFILVMVLVVLTTVVDLSPIVGAFAAGLLMHDSYFSSWEDYHQGKHTIRGLLAPLEIVIAPVFFVLIGMQVKLETLLDWHTAYLAVAVLMTALAGKWLSGLGAGRETSRLTVGFGMTPRGEVGLAFAFIGKALGVIDAAMFTVVVVMVVITTLVTPLLLRLSLRGYREAG
jgi:Kef-type K+ transport system membrane component KefB